MCIIDVDLWSKWPGVREGRKEEPADTCTRKAPVNVDFEFG